MRAQTKCSLANAFAGGVGAIGLLASSGAAAAQSLDRRFSGPLANEIQVAAEKQAQRLVAHPDIVALRPQLEAILREVPAAKLPDGEKQIGHSIDLWTMAIAVRETSADTSRPMILWRLDNSPHSWFGHTQPGMAAAGENPDHIYRGGFLDGDSTYEVSGRFGANRPVQFSLEVYQGGPAATVLKPQTASTPDLGNQVSFLADRDMEIAPDGSFTITIGPEAGATQRNHMKLARGAMTLTIRDVLSNWSQDPTSVSIRRVAGPERPPLSERDLVDRLKVDLPAYVRFWSNFNTKFLGGIRENELVGPVPRDGGWGYLAATRFNLADDEAIVITTTNAGAAYTGFQVTNPWMVMPGDARKATLSLNKTQVAANPDGSVTYVLSRSDPGIANWIDTGGLRQGFGLLRWQAVPEGADPKAMVRQFKVVKLSALAEAVPASTPRLNAAGRRAQIAKRAADYDLRLGTPISMEKR